MAARASITLTDGATTPVNHVYQPVPAESGVLKWQDRTATAVLIGQNRLTLSQRAANKQSKATKVVWKLESPILEQTSTSTATGVPPPPTIAYTNLATLDIVFADRSSTQERKDLLFSMRDLINEAIVTNQIVDQDMIY